MHHLARLFLASGACLTLTITASPALAAPPSDPGSNRANVEHLEFGNPDGSFSYEYREVTRKGDGHFISNSRDQQFSNTEDTVFSSDTKSHTTETDKVLKVNSQYSFNEDGWECRFNSQLVIANGENRRQSSHSPNC